MTSIQIYAWCKKHQQELLDAEKAGDTNARTIISTHDMMARCPDHIAYAILEQAVYERIQRSEQP